ncbi:AraC family transcriptional regulator [Alistipes sp.]|uniref:helix-turn-helix domain-containing protein n=1 Tax=Alistipes sp. TaxID=1872444 RepID=UPI0025BCF2A6|nr:AraC family transcriptional regulator [Alistipes sp.]
MGLLNLSEHASCCNYAQKAKEGFIYCQLREGEAEDEMPGTDCILFVQNGCLELSRNDEVVRVPEGKMLCLNRSCIFKLRVFRETNVVIALFEHPVQSCEKNPFSQLGKMEAISKKEMPVLDIRPHLTSFLDLLIAYLNDGVNCAIFHKLKLKELFFSIRFYYSTMEQAEFFHPVLGNHGAFKKNVLRHFRKARTVKELARLCGYSITHFNRKFVAEFNESPNDWLQKQLTLLIKHKLADEDNRIGDIAEELNFSSQPQFSRYCKNNLGYTPTEWRKLVKERRGIEIATADEIEL